MVPTWLKKFQNGPAYFWDLLSPYLAQSSYLVRNISILADSTSKQEQKISQLAKSHMVYLNTPKNYWMIIKRDMSRETKRWINDKTNT